MFGTVEDAINQAHQALDALAAIDAQVLDQTEIAELTVEMHRLQARLDAEVTRTVGVFDTSGDPEGALGTAPWVAWRCRIKKSQAKAEVSRARALKRMPEVAAAYAAGAITSEHVRLLAAAHRAAPDAFAKVEADLVENAATLRFDAFAFRVAYFRQIADPDGTEADAQDAFERRRWNASRTFEDTVAVDGTLDPMGGTVYLNELNRLETQLFDQDWAEARARLGAAATAADLRRSFGQRRADAQVLMAARSAAKPADAKAARVLLTVLIGYETFHGMMCQLADGTIVSPSQVVPWLSDADIERVVFDGPSRVIDVGAKQRLFTGATRRAVEVRDLFCTHESCDIPYERCDVDHIQRYEHDGPTIQANGRLRCPHHNPGRRRTPRPQPPPPDQPTDDDPAN